jgi:hypothetical protein
MFIAPASLPLAALLQERDVEGSQNMALVAERSHFARLFYKYVAPPEQNRWSI